MRGRVVAKLKQCVGCRSCEIACAVAHSESKVLAQAIGETPAPLSRVRVSVDDEGKMAIARCQHCRKPKCVEACPESALRKMDDGLVELDVTKCKAHGACVEACPFGAIWLRPDGSTVYKCDMCIERLDRDELPACVEACPVSALIFRPAKDEAPTTE